MILHWIIALNIKLWGLLYFSDALILKFLNIAANKTKNKKVLPQLNTKPKNYVYIVPIWDSYTAHGEDQKIVLVAKSVTY